MKNKLNVQSIFHSVDGEVNGFLGAGQLCTFVRLKGCNLQCQWCDTSYSQKSYPANWMTIPEVIEQIKFPKITITGGEPLLQLESVRELCKKLVLKGIKEQIEYEISIETNGTILPEFPNWDSVRIIMDWKSLSSGMECKMNPAAFLRLREIDVIKFVISNWNDYNRALEIIGRNPEWTAKKVFSPAIGLNGCFIDKFGVTYWDLSWPQQLVERMIHDKVDAQFSLQIHKVIWPGIKEER